ncbi:MAG: HD-GYP domain-containing protein [Bacillota bacterium]
MSWVKLNPEPAGSALDVLIMLEDYLYDSHSLRVEKMIGELAGALGLSDSQICSLRLLARYHDIGKLAISDFIVLKPGPLTPEEFREVKRHSYTGYCLARSTPGLDHVAEWILLHHEWWNGCGYPLGLKGEEIPLECRILSIVDAYDAMTGRRPYRNAMTHDDAVQELIRCAGIQFDPRLVEAFVSFLENRRGDRHRK